MSETFCPTITFRRPATRRSRIGLVVVIAAILGTITLAGLQAFPWKRLRWSIVPTAALSLSEEQPDRSWMGSRTCATPVTR